MLGGFRSPLSYSWLNYFLTFLEVQFELEMDLNSKSSSVSLIYHNTGRSTSQIYRPSRDSKGTVSFIPRMRKALSGYRGMSRPHVRAEKGCPPLCFSQEHKDTLRNYGCAVAAPLPASFWAWQLSVTSCNNSPQPAGSASVRNTAEKTCHERAALLLTRTAVFWW